MRSSPAVIGLGSFGTILQLRLELRNLKPRRLVTSYRKPFACGALPFLPDTMLSFAISAEAMLLPHLRESWSAMRPAVRDVIRPSVFAP